MELMVKSIKVGVSYELSLEHVASSVFKTISYKLAFQPDNIGIRRTILQELSDVRRGA